MTRPGDRIAAAPVSRSKKLEGVSPKRRGACRSSYERQNGRPFYERHAKRTKSRPRLRRRRLRPSKHEILTAVRPPRNLPPGQAASAYSTLSCTLLLGRVSFFHAGEDKENSHFPRRGGLHRGSSS